VLRTGTLHRGAAALHKAGARGPLERLQESQMHIVCGGQFSVACHEENCLGDEGFAC
jgi:hypothetical protein